MSVCACVDACDREWCFCMSMRMHMYVCNAAFDQSDCACEKDVLGEIASRKPVKRRSTIIERSAIERASI